MTAPSKRDVLLLDLMNIESRARELREGLDDTEVDDGLFETVRELRETIIHL